MKDKDAIKEITNKINNETTNDATYEMRAKHEGEKKSYLILFLGVIIILAFNFAAAAANFTNDNDGMRLGVSLIALFTTMFVGWSIYKLITRCK